MERAQTKPPHPATVAQKKTPSSKQSRPPHPATVAQKKAAPSEQSRPPHPATASTKERATLDQKGARTALQPMKLRERRSSKPDAKLSVIKVEWVKHPNGGPTTAQFYIKITVYFGLETGHKAEDYNYDNWKYEQEAYDETIIIDGTHKGHKDKSTWSKKEPYTSEWSESATLNEWVFIDQPGYSKGKGIAEDDNIVYKFAAKWTVWNEMTGETVRLGPYYGQITGAHPRSYEPDEVAWIIKSGNVTLTWLHGELAKGKPTGCPW